MIRLALAALAPLLLAMQDAPPDSIDMAGYRDLRIGMTGAELIALYPERTHIEPHPYGDAGDKVIHHASPDGASAMAFEVVDGRINRYRVGQHGPVQFIEGCL